MSEDISQIILQELREHRRESSVRHENMDTRVRVVETWQANAEGKVKVFGLFLAAVTSFLAWLIGVFKH